MPGLAHKNEHYSSGFWSKDVDGVSYNQLHKFWSGLSPEARHELLRIDRQALLEQARKNMCCSKCIGLLLEGFLLIVSNGNSLQQKGDLPCNRSGALRDKSKVLSHRCCGELQDPGGHLWGGLTATRDGLLTVLDCYLYAKSFKGLQTVFDSARAREKERELLYPHACGSQRMVGYGKGHGTTRETCALHTTGLYCDTLVAFLSALEEETRQSLLRMKEEDFIERLTNRFKRKKFCKDCRKNVIREFKELKELKRMQREPQCTDWFCVADTAIQYEVGIDFVRADWSQYFKENDGYQYIEWAIGTEEWETDILKYKYVGNDGSAQVNGLDLRGLHQCYITVRAFKDNGRCSEISVKAHALRGQQQCVHSWLLVGDGFVSVKRGECIRMLFEHAEEVEEQEDEVLVDKDGNEVGAECLRPQKHAKTPELAREFLLDAAAVIFKEQVEKAYRESTARENAHSILVCLSSKLLEKRVHIACKEIVTLENQKRLLEEEEKEKLEEEKRKGRKRTKEREKKLRRKERLKEKEQKNPKFSDKPVLSREEEGSLNLDEEMNGSVSCEEESATETGDVALSPPDDQDGDCLDGWTSPRDQAQTNYSDSTVREVIIDHEDGNGWFTIKEGKKMEVGIRQKKNDDMYLKDSMMSRTSSSDSCSSCLCEGDSNGNTESPLMTDSEDVSLHSEGRENVVFTENYIPDCDEKMTKKETEKGIDEKDLSRIKNMSNLPADTGFSYLSQPQSMMFPQRPVFQAPGYYHQAPVSWSVAPANGLMPFPHPNPYVYIDSLGYGTPLNHSATPFFNTLDQAQTLEPLEAADDERRDMETPSSRGPQTESDENFSLFHFGGPVALSTGSKSGDHVFGDLTAGNCKKKKEERTVGEEYNLFAKNNSLRFSIF